jgi:hypothetical protein
MRSQYPHPGDAPEMCERPRQAFRSWQSCLSVVSFAAHACAMLSVDETTAEVIRQVLEESGRELSAAIELRWHFP